MSDNHKTTPRQKQSNKHKDTTHLSDHTNISTDTNPEETISPLVLTQVEDILLNLKIIGAIKKKDRLSKNVDDIFEIECNDFLQGVRRWWRGQNRHDAIKGIKKIIQATFKVTDETLCNEQSDNPPKKTSTTKNQTNYFTQENSSLLQRFTIEMERSCSGLENLKSTYQDDVRIVSEIDIMIEQLRLRIDKINKILTIDLGRV